MTAPYDPEPTEIYEPATGKWTAAAPMPTGAIAPPAAGLPDGRLLFAGGSGGAAPLSETQIYTPSTLPGAPRAVGAVPGDGAATVTWTPPARDGDNPIRGYTVTASSGQQVSAPDERTSIAVSGLTNGQPVTFTVTARTAFGIGAASAPSAAVTPTAPPPAVTQPGATDATAPTVKLAGLKKKLKRKTLLKGLKLTATPSEPAKLSITLLASKRTKRPRYTVKLASKSFGLGGKHTLRLKPKRSRVSRAKKFSVRVRIVATDAAGNQRTTTTTIKVSR